MYEAQYSITQSLVLEIQFYKTGFYEFIMKTSKPLLYLPLPNVYFVEISEQLSHNMLHIFKNEFIIRPHVVFFFAPRKVGLGVLASLAFSLWSVLN